MRAIPKPCRAPHCPERGTWRAHDGFCEKHRNHVNRIVRSRKSYQYFPVKGIKCKLNYENICTFWSTTVDHIVPIARGGSDLPYNLQPACKPCNDHKGSGVV